MPHVVVKGENVWNWIEKIHLNLMMILTILYGAVTGATMPNQISLLTLLYSTYQSNDLRRTAFFRTVSGYQQYKGSYAESASVFFTGIANDEVYLNRAECNAFLGNIAPGHGRPEPAFKIALEERDGVCTLSGH